MRLTMQERKTVTKALATQHRRAAKNEKGRLLEQFDEATGYDRVYAARLLRNFGVRRELAPGIVVEASRRGKAKRPRAGPSRERCRPRPSVTCLTRSRRFGKACLLPCEGLTRTTAASSLTTICTNTVFRRGSLTPAAAPTPSKTKQGELAPPLIPPLYKSSLPIK